MVTDTKTPNKNKNIPGKQAVGWRLPTGNLNKAKTEADRLGMTITEFINFLIVSYFASK